MLKDKNSKLLKIKVNQIFPESKKLGLKLQCRICKYIAVEPYCSSKCGHLFCKECLNKLEHPIFKCPKDNERINRDETKKYYIDYYNDSLYCHCKFRSTGCNWIGNISEYGNHFIKGHLNKETTF